MKTTEKIKILQKKFNLTDQELKLSYEYTIKKGILQTRKNVNFDKCKESSDSQSYSDEDSSDSPIHIDLKRSFNPPNKKNVRIKDSTREINRMRGSNRINMNNFTEVVESNEEDYALKKSLVVTNREEYLRDSYGKLQKIDYFESNTSSSTPRKRINADQERKKLIKMKKPNRAHTQKQQIVEEVLKEKMKQKGDQDSKNFFSSLNNTLLTVDQTIGNVRDEKKLTDSEQKEDNQVSPGPKES